MRVRIKASTGLICCLNNPARRRTSSSCDLTRSEGKLKEIHISVNLSSEKMFLRMNFATCFVLCVCQGKGRGDAGRFGYGITNARGSKSGYNNLDGTRR